MNSHEKQKMAVMRACWSKGKSVLEQYKKTEINHVSMTFGLYLRDSAQLQIGEIVDINFNEYSYKAEIINIMIDKDNATVTIYLKKKEEICKESNLTL